MIFKFNRRYFLHACLLLVILVLIALFVHDAFIRPFVGDILVVLWMYLVLRAILNWQIKTVAICVLIFAYSVEIGQYFNLVDLLGLQQYRAARIIIGSTFDWLDLLAYSLGFGSIFIYEAWSSQQKKR